MNLKLEQKKKMQIFLCFLAIPVVGLSPSSSSFLFLFNRSAFSFATVYIPSLSTDTNSRKKKKKKLSFKFIENQIKLSTLLSFKSKTLRGKRSGGTAKQGVKGSI